MDKAWEMNTGKCIPTWTDPLDILPYIPLPFLDTSPPDYASAHFAV